ncbi:TetR/AcrR family transcriptional regulator [Fructilactobacillus sp. Tb1]|uniref:TetR/AcrR family transcriptional regulator n=1 Tax=Fructilactobacillus sp. Tb1 TaxID=3422304 RepID=UPI003D2BBC57
MQITEKASNKTVVGKKSMDRIANAMIAEVSKKNLSDITVQSVIKVAGVARKTFYNHFANLDDVISYVFDKVNGDLDIEYFFDLTDKDQVITQGLLIISDRIYEHRDVIRIMYLSDLKGYWRDYIYEKYGPVIKNVLFKNFKNCGIPKNTAAAVYTNIYLALVEDWLISPIPSNPVEFRQRVFNVLQTTPEDLLYNRS